MLDELVSPLSLADLAFLASVHAHAYRPPNLYLNSRSRLKSLPSPSCMELLSCLMCSSIAACAALTTSLHSWQHLSPQCFVVAGWPQSQTLSGLSFTAWSEGS